MLRLFALVLFAAAATLRCQQTVVVSGGGPALQNAILAASPGDTLLVRGGTYSAIRVDKGLRILCDAGVLIVDATTVPLHVLDVPSSQTLVVRQVRISSLGYGSEPCMVVSDCAGLVILDGVDDVTPWSGGERTIATCSGTVIVRDLRAVTVFSQLRITGCNHVHLADSPDLPNVFADSSNVHISNCTVPSRQNNLAAVTSIASTVTINSCSLSGGPLTASFWWSRPGIAMSTSEVCIGGSSTIIGGTNLVNAEAIQATSGLLTMAPSTSLVVVGVPPITGAATVVSELIPTVMATGVNSLMLFTGQIEAEPGSYTAVHFNLPIAPLQLPFGTAWIPLGSLVLDSGIMPASGTRTFSLLVPPLPLALPLVLQSVSLTTSGAILLGPPRPVVFN